MVDAPLKDRCKVVNNIKSDSFVGIKCDGNNISISFPLGFRLGTTEKGIRKDILTLLNVLSKNTDKMESEFNHEGLLKKVHYPIQAYLQLIWDFFSRGYYKESENIYYISKRGKIDWNRTIKTRKTFVQDHDIYYLDFVTKRKNVSENELISLIHQYCVHESFLKIGWLFTSFIPPEAPLKFNKKLFTAIVKKKISETFNDRSRQLFKHMLAIIVSLGEDGSIPNYEYGTTRFEYVWEAMIDSVYGIKHKEEYFPSSRWIFNDGKQENSKLEPDTIMLVNNRKSKVYVLDAKYYTFGCKENGTLPGSTSINKQITYGEFIAESGKFNDESGNKPTVYNAFLMPYDKFGETFCTEKSLHYIGSAISDWKASDGTNTYEQVAGILLDVKTLMNDFSHSDTRIVDLANLIEENVMKIEK